MCDLGLAYDLNRFEMNEIKRGELDMQQKQLNFKKSFLNWGIPIHTLPEWTPKDIQTQIKKGKIIIILAGIVTLFLFFIIFFLLFYMHLYN